MDCQELAWDLFIIVPVLANVLLIEGRGNSDSEAYHNACTFWHLSTIAWVQS